MYKKYKRAEGDDDDDDDDDDNDDDDDDGDVALNSFYGMQHSLIIPTELPIVICL